MTQADDGWSGATFQRPKFQEMMDELRAGIIDCVLVKDLTRFGRSFGEAGKVSFTKAVGQLHDIPAEATNVSAVERRAV